jgi:hypothetical protein
VPQASAAPRAPAPPNSRRPSHAKTTPAPHRTDRHARIAAVTIAAIAG